jgi:hypothetical protein
MRHQELLVLAGLVEYLRDWGLDGQGLRIFYLAFLGHGHVGL